MKYVDEFRDPKRIKRLENELKTVVTKKWTIMEVCGGQTHAIAKFGLMHLLPKEIELIHGPGCPVCVTPMPILDQAIALASTPGVIFCSFGDMLRVPGSDTDLLSAKAKGGQVQMVYSPLDAVTLAEKNKDKEVVFFAVGFETTAPANAFALWTAKQKRLKNFSMLCSHVLVPPALEFILKAPNNCVEGFLAAGHVCTVMGYEAYHAITQKYHVPIVVTGFEPLDIMQGILSCTTQLQDQKAFVENQYTRCVLPKGNQEAQAMLFEIFEISDQLWRGLGEIPQSGLKIKSQYSDFNATYKFPYQKQIKACTSVCISGEILTGQKKPPQCPAFGKSCTPEKPLGAPMVSSEGACSAYYKYQS